MLVIPLTFSIFLLWNLVVSSNYQSEIALQIWKRKMNIDQPFPQGWPSLVPRPSHLFNVACRKRGRAWRLCHVNITNSSYLMSGGAGMLWSNYGAVRYCVIANVGPCDFAAKSHFLCTSFLMFFSATTRA